MKHLWVVVFSVVSLTATAGRAALQLSAMSNPTLQSLIALGNTPVAVGPMLFSNFSFTDTSTGIPLTASQIQVQPYTSTGDGLEFIAGWYAAGGTTFSDNISYTVQSTGTAHPIGQITLLANATAPVAASNTFTTSTLLAQTLGGTAAAPLLSTYNDGVMLPVDTTKPDVNFASTVLNPQNVLLVTSTLLGNSAGGGVASASVVEDSFVPVSVPEPSQTGWFAFTLIGLLAVVSRPGRNCFCLQMRPVRCH